MSSQDHTLDETQLHKRLSEMIQQLPQKRQWELLRLLEDWQKEEKRELPRKSQVLPVDFAAGDGMRRDFIKDISSGGVFIETRAALEVGQEITMTFQLPNAKIPIRLSGVVVRKTSEGVGVKFSWSMKG